MGAFAGLANALEQSNLEHRQDKVMDRQRQLDDLERSIQIYQQGGGTNPDGTPMSPQQRQQAIQGAVSQRISLSTPEEGPQLFQRLRDLFHGGAKKPGVLPTGDQSQPWDEKVPGVATNPQTGAPVVPKGGGQDVAPQQPMATHNPADLVKMAQQGAPMSIGQIVSGASAVPQPMHAISDAPKRGADGQYYMWYANQDGSNPHRVLVPDWNDETSLQGKWQEYENTYKALHDGATPPEEMRDKWLSIQGGIEAKPGKAGASKQKFINEPDPSSPTGVSTVAHDSESGDELWRKPLLQSGLLEGQRTGYTTVTDADGNTHRIPYTSTTRKVLPKGKAATADSGVSPAPTQAPIAPVAAPATSGNASTLKRNGSDIIAYKGSEAYKKLNQAKVTATVELNELNSRVSTMEQSMDRAKAGDGPAQVGIVAAYIKSMVGGQGVRVTQAEWNQATQTAPWLARVGAHFTDDGFFSYTTNPLTADQIDSMAKSVKEKTQATKDKLGEFKQQIQDQKAADTGQNKESAPASPEQTKEEIKKLLRQSK